MARIMEGKINLYKPTFKVYIYIYKHTHIYVYMFLLQRILTEKKQTELNISYYCKQKKQHFAVLCKFHTEVLFSFSATYSALI